MKFEKLSMDDYVANHLPGHMNIHPFTARQFINANLWFEPAIVLKIPFNDPNEYHMMSDWAEENLSHDFRVFYCMDWIFESENDAMLFVLKWS
jgi:hypothetical protein